MFSPDDLTLDCSTCLAANTTACGECIVTHLLANDAGPIAFVPAAVRVARRGALSDTARVIELFADAGLLGDDAHFVPFSEFAGREVPQLAR